MNNLKNKIIIVTGGSGLLGKEIIANLKNKGAIAINADINVNTDLDNFRLKFDITSEKSIIEGVKKLAVKFGRINGVVNNAYPRTKDWGAKFEDISYKSWKKNIDIQLNSVFLVIKHFIPELIKTKGSI